MLSISTRAVTPGYDAARDGPLPTIMWAYPREFNSAEAAGQLRDSPSRFTGIGATSPLVWLSRGYAVIDGRALHSFPFQLNLSTFVGKCQWFHGRSSLS